MKINDKKEVVEIMAYRYHQGKKVDKIRILNELCDIYGYNRKYLIQILNFKTGKKYIRKGPKFKYLKKGLLPPLTSIWLATGQMCSKKLKAAMPEWLPFYDESKQSLNDAIKAQLLSLSSATIDRLLKPQKVKYKRHGLSGTRPGTLLKNQIPIKTDHWDVTQAGFMEADTVAHCGNSLAGSFVWSVTMTDIHTGWTEIRATWNKGASGVVTQIKDIEVSLPFAILGFDCDNGSEFLNHHLIRYFAENRSLPVQFTRSRPYRKNDNAHVEQKNWTHVRHLFGYDRFDDPILISLMNDLYKNEWSLYQNHFVPVMKLVDKVRINSKYRKKYDEPKTPYQRILETPEMTEETKDKLRQIHANLNPFTLKKEIEKKLHEIFKYVTVNKNARTKI
jgi:hypothetical protein